MGLLARELRGPRWVFKSPHKQCQCPASRKAASRSAGHQGLDTQGSAGGGRGWAWTELSALRQVWPRCSFPHPARFLIHRKDWDQTHLGEEGWGCSSGWGQMGLIQVGPCTKEALTNGIWAQDRPCVQTATPGMLSACPRGFRCPSSWGRGCIGKTHHTQLGGPVQKRWR